MPVTIMLADDHRLFTSAIRHLISADPALHVTHVAANGLELLELLCARLPDIVLIDINMPVMNGLDTTRLIRDRYPRVKVIIVSGYNDAHLIDQAIDAGARGYLLKDCNAEDLYHTIHLVHSGQTCFPFRPHLPVQNFETDNAFLQQFNLTRREKEILLLISRQHTNQQIADHLHLSIYTIETHRKNIMKKLQLKTPAALMKFILTHPCHSVIFGFYCLVLLS
ncbi:response regulator transcription factor [Chitinophaga sancti]|uniref:Response regulator transcription factor n=1 Tax=Chitinophaga sancti TaxID=1004 RepID=A0A1K1RSK5_9BACT|nr:response regulator transcription factor [Chitinophaga sancti]WQD62418.1 response regulator transcription factor [Chitinophaga sancti]WQG92013.1 response regulator transcription factor [Chitinophaga sancti]SFW75275.1 two component transcriptional regulator, LuxR family [Chitinophaga sancti]